ncbi:MULTISPECIES: ATP-dependent DNA helicase DinG [unclassified Bacillus (in: firmicutes)]|uniref:ATP-dependent DNA helicase DinG n=1 Tax=unclassified Bacillus (in: firmicutes) TaxID=185979 RepID=UPI001BE812DF|nr:MULTISPECIES: ATP-dependent DNA helicase DinG [unclassified Bacillus (in: firmicutes)]MBT2639075.1 ATP-dependent DNA helicase DinG [Bacillus sp. ISL-39]MBT2662316.1 ATP-dependent DNA helicase DinG [Bacillus sp. ISL-45]
MSQKFVVVDLETTGNSPKKGDRIIQFGAVIIEDGKITGRFSSLVNPLQEIPAFIEELTGISDSMVKDAPLFEEIAPQISDMLEDAYFVAHNVLFDLSFLQDELLSSGQEGFYGPVIDTVEMARILYPSADSYKLTDLAAREKLHHDRPHQADSDAQVTAELLLIMLDAVKSLPLVTVKELAKLSEGLKSDLHLIFDDVLTVKESRLEELPDHLEVYRGIALKKRNKIRKVVQSTIEYPESLVEKKILLQKAFSGYEIRHGQFEMMDCVREAFSKNGHALIEAGTGVGKSLGYLIPAAIFALESNKPVVVSTYTTQLQEQLLFNDVPKLAQVMGTSINATLIKGRNNYISMARFEQSLREVEENYDTALTKMQILVWLTQTETGDFDELNLSSGGMLFWGKVKNERALFLKTKHWEGHDFYQRAVEKAQHADILITNHSMMLADLVSDKGPLPNYDYAVLDEGHQFEKAAGKYFGKSLDYLAVRLVLNQLGLYDQNQLFYKLETLLNHNNGDFNSGRLHSFEINQLISDLVYETEELFKLAGTYARKTLKNKTHGSKIHASMVPDRDNRIWNALKTTAERFYFHLKDLISALEERLLEAGKSSQQYTGVQQSILEEVVQVKEDLEQICITARTLFMDDSGYVRWIEADMRALQNSTTIFSRPVYVSDYLAEQFFAKKRSVVVTSATLSVNNSFTFIKKELGIRNTLMEKQIPSPFSYGSQVKLVVPDDLPDIKSVSNDDYVAAVTEHIISIAEATKGRMLILFTSHEMLKKAYELIKESGLLEEYILIAQGITAGSRTRLTRNFKRFEKAILFGTSSFWEGVDIPGEDLSCLIIVRLPFTPPDEPITAAKCSLIKEKGGSPFSELSLPEAVLRFKQGFGRLIRTSNDRGLIFVFDRRLVTTSYGRAFLHSVPDVPVEKRSITEIVEMIHDWL